MTAVQRELFMEQGAIFTTGFNWYRADATDNTKPGDPYDVVGKVARMQVRQRLGSPVLVDASTSNGMITLGPNGRVDIRIPGTATQALNVTKCVYDLEIDLDDQGDTRRLMEGPVSVSLNVTTDAP